MVRIFAGFCVGVGTGLWIGFADAASTFKKADPSLDDPLHPRLPYKLRDVVWAARYELARTVEDVLARRTNALFLDARAAIGAAPLVASTLAKEREKRGLGKS